MTGGSARAGRRRGRLPAAALLLVGLGLAACASTPEPASQPPPPADGAPTTTGAGAAAEAADEGMAGGAPPAGEPVPAVAPGAEPDPAPSDRAAAEGPREPAVPPPPDPLGDDWLEEDWLDQGPTPADRDPWEGLNRGLHGFNEVVHQWFFDPVADAYEFVVPSGGRRAVYRFFDNLGEPVTFVNHVLQLAPVDAGATGARFVVNSTVGVVGLFDPARHIGLAQRPTDFGQTLAIYRVGSGPYLIVPVLGPSTLRDAVGGLVDASLRPDVWLLGMSPLLISLAAGQGLSLYEAEHERIDALRETSVDFYSALRAAYLMNRDARVAARIERVRGGGEPPAPEAPDPQLAGPEPEAPPPSQGPEADAPASDAGGDAGGDLPAAHAVP